MPEIKVVPLGAGQDVGRSCILVTIGGKNIMLDCGMHMGYNDEVFSSVCAIIFLVQYLPQACYLLRFIVSSCFCLHHLG